MPIISKETGPRLAEPADALALAQASGNMINTLLATTCLGQIQQLENQLYLAAATYQRVLQLIRDYSPSNAGVVTFGLARICYEWNDLESAEQYGEQTLQLARQYSQFVNRFIMCGVFLARLKLVRGDESGAAALLAQAEQSVREHDFVHRMPEVASELRESQKLQGGAGGSAIDHDHVVLAAFGQRGNLHQTGQLFHARQHARLLGHQVVHAAPNEDRRKVLLHASPMHLHLVQQIDLLAPQVVRQRSRLVADPRVERVCQAVSGVGAQNHRTVTQVRGAQRRRC